MNAPMMLSDLRQRVDLGIAWLDARHPGWHDLIDVDLIDVASPCRCILGQTIGYFPGPDLDTDQAAALGFEASTSHDGMAEEYEALSGLWRTAVLRRRAGSDEP
ncbi:hypothetical protein ACFUYE_29415 [Micromonospora humida]|uniref:hypothetical protein n=1 Tax=Micromonospora humida TaxID=2809018 RepID=UPI0036716C85